LQCQDQLEEAAACFLRAREIGPEHVEALTNLGNVFLKLGKLREAIRYYQEAWCTKAEAIWNSRRPMRILFWLRFRGN